LSTALRPPKLIVRFSMEKNLSFVIDHLSLILF
jgi:hypothetical protein